MSKKIFCYCCKAQIEVNDLEDFRKSGHVETRELAHSKYQINTNKLQKDFELS